MPPPPPVSRRDCRSVGPPSVVGRSVARTDGRLVIQIRWEEEEGKGMKRIQGGVGIRRYLSGMLRASQTTIS